MAKLVVALFALLMIATIMPAQAVPSGQGQQLFFDNFSTSQLSPNWNFARSVSSQYSAGNLTQAGGWLSLTENRQLFQLATCASLCPIAETSAIASNVQPIISPSTTSQFVFMVWRMIPFNLTQVGNSPGSNSVVRNAIVTFGLENNSTTNSDGFGFNLIESDNPNCNLGPSLCGQREGIDGYIFDPMGGGLQAVGDCYIASIIYVYNPINSAQCTRRDPGFVYSNPNNPIDLNNVHLFTIEALLNKGNSWIAFQVDNSAWLNMTQVACSCIDQNAGSYVSLYPWIDSLYCMGTGANACLKTTVNQSLGTLVNYVLVDNYVPSTLPAGSRVPTAPPALPTIANTPNVLNPFGFLGGWTSLWQSWAQALGKGVPSNTGQFAVSSFYFGGAMLYAITIVLILSIFIFSPKPLNNPFVVLMILFFDTIIQFILGTLQIWIFATALIVVMAALTGTIAIGGKKGGGSVGGGVVA